MLLVLRKGDRINSAPGCSKTFPAKERLVSKASDSFLLSRHCQANLAAALRREGVERT